MRGDLGKSYDPKRTSDNKCPCSMNSIILDPDWNIPIEIKVTMVCNVTNAKIFIKYFISKYSLGFYDTTRDLKKEGEKNVVI